MGFLNPEDYPPGERPAAARIVNRDPTGVTLVGRFGDADAVIGLDWNGVYQLIDDLNRAAYERSRYLQSEANRPNKSVG